MLLKLTIPYHNRQFRGGVIARWHKAPGDYVAFGDDLLEVDVREVVTVKKPDKAREYLQALMQTPQARDAEAKRPGENGANGAEADKRYAMRSAEFSMTITASGEGFLRTILATVGVACRVGDTVAIISTERDEPLDRLEDVLGQGSTFPTVPNPIMR